MNARVEGRNSERSGLSPLMASSPSEQQVGRFVLNLLHTGSCLSELVSNLAVALPAESYRGEEPRTVVLEMLCGTIGTALRSADLRDLQRATQLIDLAHSRTLEHLRLARDLSRRIHDGDDGVGRTYG
jgi:hypothetical protein